MCWIETQLELQFISHTSANRSGIKQMYVFLHVINKSRIFLCLEVKFKFSGMLYTFLIYSSATSSLHITFLKQQVTICSLPPSLHTVCPRNVLSPTRLNRHTRAVHRRTLKWHRFSLRKIISITNTSGFPFCDTENVPNEYIISINLYEEEEYPGRTRWCRHIWTWKGLDRVWRRSVLSEGSRFMWQAREKNSRAA